MFAAWGRFVHRRRVPVLLASGLLLVASAVLVAQGGTLLAYQAPEGAESTRAFDLMEAQIPSGDEARLLVILSHPTMGWQDARFRAAALAAVEPLRDDPRVASVTLPYDQGAPAAEMVSRDGRRVLAFVALEDDLLAARDQYPELRPKIRSDALDVLVTDQVAVYSDLEQALAKDLRRSEAVALPVVLLLLLVVFGSVVAAILPLGVGLLAVLGGVGGVFLASRFVDVSVYAVNIVTLVGLGVAIDYSLFIVSRFREETRAGDDAEAALARTMATAGRATAFSGLTVAIGLMGLAFFQGLFFASVGMAGGIVVTLAVAYALTFLPALLSLLGPRIDRWRFPLARLAHGPGLWGPLARGVMRRPVLVLAPTLALLVVAGLPFLDVELGGATEKALPEGAESRRGLDVLRAEFPRTAGSAIPVVVRFDGGDPLSRDRVGALHDHSRALAALDGARRVESVVDLSPAYSKEDYQTLYAQPRAQWPAPVAAAVERSVGDDIVVLSLRTDLAENSREARDLVERARALPPPAGATVLVSGSAAVDADTLAVVYERAPVAIAFVVLTTYVLLLLQTGSVVLPAKAILMNFLSIAASFGAMVWVFQQGNLSAVLDFTPQPLDPSLPVLLFCIVFGLSMDYEVLLLSRMHEEYERTGDNAQAVAAGLEKSGRLITSAAAIMVVVFGAFALAQVTLIKAIGLGLALAIAVDATVVRALVVPAAMRLMGRWNWWAPAPVTRLWRLLG